MSYIAPRVSNRFLGIEREREKPAVVVDQAPDFSLLVATWTNKFPIPRLHLFYPNKTPKVCLLIDLWKPLINTYFRHYNIPRERCTQVWMDIVECIFMVPNDPDYLPNHEFCAWAYGCMCRFVLEDRRLDVEAYNPETPGYFAKTK